MMKGWRSFWMVLVVAVAAMFGAPSGALAATIVGQCENAPGPAAFVLDENRLGQQASEINFWYVSGRPAEMSHEEAIRIRGEKIQKIYDDARAAREKDYVAASCVVESTKKCSSHSGQTNRCPMLVQPPSVMRFVAGSIQPVGNGIKAGPALVEENVAYTIGKSGSGSNTGGFRANAVYVDSHIKARLDAEMTQVAQYVTPILNAGTGTVVAGPPPVLSPKPAVGSIADELAKLAKLRDEGVLTAEEFEILKRRLLGF